MFSSQPSSCLFVLSGPCGTGKTSLALAWLKEDPDLVYIPSVTTRKSRKDSKIHENYEYVSRNTFLHPAEEGAFAQWINPS